MKVFIVEDSGAMRTRLTGALEELPDTRVVGWADAAYAATLIIRRVHPDLVIVDLRLAQGNGLDVVDAVKRMEPAPLVVVFTNYPHQQYRTRCAELGADYFFDKAEGLDGLLEACRVVSGAGMRAHA